MHALSFVEYSAFRYRDMKEGRDGDSFPASSAELIPILQTNSPTAIAPLLND